MTARPFPPVFERQWLHVLLLALLLGGFAQATRIDGFGTGELWGLESTTWAWIAVVLAVVHQGLVWFFWRTQLHLGLITRVMGPSGFTLYAVLFSILGIARTAAVFLVALANRDTIPAYRTLLQVLAVILALPAAYSFYSVRRYFGFRRAFGIDHFDPSYRSMPIVKQGIFRLTSNGMYVFGFLILWVAGLWFGSIAALIVALFNHLYIWVHYYSTELPDMRRIYGSGAG